MLLDIISVITISGFPFFVVFVWFFANLKQTPLTSERIDDALTASGLAASSVTVDLQGRAALAKLSDDAGVAYIRTVGAKAAVLIPTLGDIIQVRLRQSEARLDLQFRTLAQPPIDFEFADRTQAANWQTRLQQFMAPMDSAQ